MGTQIAGANSASTTRAVVAGGYTDQSTDSIDTVEMASRGNASDFGNLTTGRDYMSGMSNSIRGVFAGGRNQPSVQYNDVIDYITIATVGNATDFGDFATSVVKTAGGVASSTRGLVTGGIDPSGVTNVIQYITIASTSDTTDFGDLTAARGYPAVGPICSSTRGLTMGGTEPSLSNIIDYVTIASAGDATDFGNLTDARQVSGGLSNSLRALACGGEDTNGNLLDINYVTIASTGDAADFGDLTATGAIAKPTGNSDSHGGLQG